MTAKESALYQFWSQFGWPAYNEHSVPSDKDHPMTDYITYEVATASFGEQLALTASLWQRSPSWKELSEKTQLISEAIGRGGKVIPCEGGALWIQRGAPFSRLMVDASDELTKRIIINIVAEFLTAN